MTEPLQNRRTADKGGVLPRRAPQRPNLSRALQIRIFRRDKWLCRYCLYPVVFPPAMKFLQQYVLSRRPSAKLAYWSFAWRRDASPLLDVLGAVVDHVEPFSGGGPSEESNLVTACYKCNVTKSSTEKAVFLKRHPPRRIRGKYGEPEQWDGFSTLFVILFEDYRSAATRSELAWYEALKGQ